MITEINFDGPRNEEIKPAKLSIFVKDAGKNIFAILKIFLFLWDSL